MKKIIDMISKELADGFAGAGYDPSYGKVTLSNRPDLCEYQCNGAMAGAKTYKKAPFMIAEDVAGRIKDRPCFEEVSVVKPGFINLKLNKEYIADYLNKMGEDPALGLDPVENPKMILVDYGGPNVAKPLHVGHLRSAIIGESIKRIARKMGHKVLGDIHLGDWGYQMGLIITELKKRQPQLPYFQEDFQGEYPEEAPFTIGELEEIYPTASQKAKEDEAYREEALHATYLLQNGHRGYRAVWNHIMAVSVSDLKKNYEKLHVEFDLWKGESDAQAYIPDYDRTAESRRLRSRRPGRSGDRCAGRIRHQGGSALHDPEVRRARPFTAPPDLATLVQREEDYHPGSGDLSGR